MTETLESLLATENRQLDKLNDIVLKFVEEEKLITQKLYEFEEKNISFDHKAADKVAAFVGSWLFIFSFTAMVAIWILVNVFAKDNLFDPYPFILLNLILSTIAAIQAPVILMSQNRKEKKDRERAINDYLVNLKAEIEVRKLHDKMDLLISEQMKTMFEIQNMQIEVMEEIRKDLKKNGLKGGI